MHQMNKICKQKVKCPKIIHIREVAAQKPIFFQSNIWLSIVYIIQTGHTSLHFYSFIVLYENAIQERYLQLRSSTKYYPNANNSHQKLLLNKFYANFSSILKYLFINSYFVESVNLVIWVENPKKWVYLFTDHPVTYLK